MTRELITHGIVAALFLAGGYYLGNKNKPMTFQGPAQITVHGDDLIVAQHPSPGVTKLKKIYQPDPDSTVITTDAKGDVTVKVKHVGYGFQPGIGFGYADRTRLVLDARLLYWDRLSLTGLGAFSFDHGATFAHVGLAAAYALPFDWLSNTSAFLGILENKKVIGGLRVRF